jgi:hypothetical protein
MLNLDSPNISNLAEPEQNIQSIKGWAEYLVGELNYQLQMMEDEIAMLQMEISAMKEETK